MIFVKSIAQYIFKQVRNFYRLEIVSVFLTVCFSISVIVTPYFTRYLIDLFSKDIKLTEIWFVILVFLITCFLQPLFFFLNTRVVKIIAEKIILKIRCALFDRIIKAAFTFFCKNSSGSIISHLVSDSNQVGLFLSNGLNILFQNALFVLLILLGMFFLSKLITILLGILILIYVAFNLFFSKSFEQKAEKVYDNNDEFYKIIKQCLDNIEEIKTTQQEAKISSLFLNFAEDFYRNRLKLFSLHNVLDSVNATIGVLSISLIYITGFFLIAKGKLTIGSVVALDLYFHMVMPSIKQLLQLNSTYHEAIPAFARLEEYFAIAPEQRLITCPSFDNVLSICFDRVTFRYDDNPKHQTVLKQFSFRLEAPGLYGLVGKSGAGKSTIAKLMVGLYHPLEGNIRICLGKDTISNARDYIGYVSQNMKLFYNKTVMYNITLGDRTISDQEVHLICERLNLHDKILKLPQKYEELVTEKVNFSGGEVQRIILARICLQKRPIIILDEITSALDDANVGIVKGIIDELSESSLVVLLTHNLGLLNKAKQIINIT